MALGDYSLSSVYVNDEYLRQNATWHVEDSPWKAQQVMKIIKANKLTPKSVCEVGCGAGEILVQLYENMPNDVNFTGFDISTQLGKMWSSRTRDRLKFCQKNFIEQDQHYDLLLFIDVIEHLEDYIGFLRTIKPKGVYKIFNFPLELFAAKALLGRKYIDSRRKYGHLHYFNRDICLEVLKDLDFEVIDYFYAAGAIDLASVTTSISLPSRLLKLPRQLLSLISVDFTAKLLGGYSLFILAK
jgi:hypothetical protein